MLTKDRFRKLTKRCFLYGVFILIFFNFTSASAATLDSNSLLSAFRAYVVTTSPPVVKVAHSLTSGSSTTPAFGLQGPQGIPGPQGERGPQGIPGKDGASLDTSSFVSRTLFDNQVNGLLNSISNDIQGLSDSLGDEVDTDLLNVNGNGSFLGNLKINGTLTTPLILGGLAEDSFLSLQSTSGTGTTDFINFKVGDNGGTEAMRITSSGNIGIGTSAPTEKLSVVGNLSVSGTGNFSTINQAPWALSEDFSSDIVRSMAVYNGKLYAGMGNDEGEGDVYVFDGTTWSLSNDFGSHIDDVHSLAVYNGKLYAGLGEDAGEGDVYVFDGTTWSLAHDFGSNIDRAEALTVYNGKLYIGLADTSDDGDVYSFDGSVWAISHDFGTGIDAVHTLAVYNGKLYAGLGDNAGEADVYSFDGSTWAFSGHLTDPISDVKSLAVYNGKLYAGAGDELDEGDIFVFDGITWSLSHDFGPNATAIQSMAVYNGKLYAGVGDPTNGANVYSFDGANWSISYDFPSTSSNQNNSSLVVYNGKLYSGSSGGNGKGDIFVYSEGLESQLLKEFNPAASTSFNEQYQSFANPVSFANTSVFNSGLTLGNNANTTAGTIRWSGTDFEGYTGSGWISLSGGVTTIRTQPMVIKYKNANESVSNSTTLQNDDDLFFSIGANETWTARFVIQGNSGTSPDFKFAVAAPTGATCRVGYTDSEGSTSGGGIACGSNTGSIPGNTADDVYEIVATITNGSTPGIVNLQWAQATLAGTSTTVKSGSFLNAFKVFGGAGTAQAFVHEGQALGELAQLGTTDNFGLALLTNGTERLRIDTSGNLKLAGTAVRGTTEGTNHLDIFDGTAPAGTLANGISLYSSSGVLFVMNAAGTATQLSPHDPVTDDWIFNSSNTTTGKSLIIDMEQMMKELNASMGWDYVHETKDGEPIAATVPSINLAELNLNLNIIAGLDTALPGSPSESFVSSFFDNVFGKITTWLADTGNGIGDMFANVLNAKEKICVDDECLTKDDIHNLLLLTQPNGSSNGDSSSHESSNDNNSNGDQGSSNDTPDETCSDNIQNQDETGIDTGGVCTPETPAEDITPPEEPAPTCSDGIKNQDETEIDAGGVCGSVDPAPEDVTPPGGDEAPAENTQPE